MNLITTPHITATADKENDLMPSLTPNLKRLERETAMLDWKNWGGSDKGKSLTFDDVAHTPTSDEQNIMSTYASLRKIDISRLQWSCTVGASRLLKGRDYLYIDNGASVLGVAHCDTVFDPSPLEFKRRGKYAVSGALDDRLGVYILLEYLPALGYSGQYDILLTTNEEVCRSTARMFALDWPDILKERGKGYNWIFEFDRAGSDVVLYNYDDSATRTLLAQHGFKVGYGSYSDIADLESLGVKAFNFGCGYYNAHSELCHAHMPLVESLVARFVQFFEAEKDTLLSNTYVKWGKRSRKSFMKYAELEQWQDYKTLEKQADEDELDYYGDTGMLDLMYEASEEDIAEVSVRDPETVEAVLWRIKQDYGRDYILAIIAPDL